MDKFGRVTAASAVQNYHFKSPFIETPQGNLDFKRKRLENIDFPETAHDAATKGYVDLIQANVVSLEHKLDISAGRLSRIVSAQAEISNKLDTSVGAFSVKISDLEHHTKVNSQSLHDRIHDITARQVEISNKLDATSDKIKKMDNEFKTQAKALSTQINITRQLAAKIK